MLLLALAGALLVRTLTGAMPLNGYVLDKPYLYLPLHLLFLGEHWTLAEAPPYMTPYWSLYFEAWYYLLMPTALSTYNLLDLFPTAEAR